MSGTAAPKLKPQTAPESSRLSRRVLKNRARESALDARMLLFLCAAVAAAVVFCVVYLNLQAQIKTQAGEITTLESEVAQQKADNDAKYNSIHDSVNLEAVKDRAINELGMTYVTEDQVIYYDEPQEDYMKQVEAIPEDTVDE